MMRFPLELIQVVAEGAEQVQGAANGFGRLIDATIRIEPEHDGEPAIILRYYSYAEQGWFVEIVPAEAVPE